MAEREEVNAPWTTEYHAWHRRAQNPDHCFACCKEALADARAVTQESLLEWARDNAAHKKGCFQWPTRRDAEFEQPCDCGIDAELARVLARAAVAGQPQDDRLTTALRLLRAAIPQFGGKRAEEWHAEYRALLARAAVSEGEQG